MKKLILVLFSFMLIMIMWGCSKNEETSSKGLNSLPQHITLKDVALKEKELTEQLIPIHNKIAELYAQFESGKLDRQELNNELLKIKPQVEKLKLESKEFYQVDKDFSLTDPQYTNSLEYGRKARLVVSAMITIPVDGVMIARPDLNDPQKEPKIEFIKLNDEQLKKKYKEKEQQYQDDINRLNKGLEL